jgi:hypothetical protein
MDDLLQHWLVRGLELDCLHFVDHLVEMMNKPLVVDLALEHHLY